MDQNRMIATFVSLCNSLEELKGDDQFLNQIRLSNPWYVKTSIVQSIEGIQAMLTKEALGLFYQKNSFPSLSKRIGLVLAGNLPGVGFHDVLVSLLMNASVEVKLSSDDQLLIPAIIDKLKSIDDELGGRVKFVFTLKLDHLDGVIATGSNNTARYFKTYFSSKPHIIRHNRTSVAVLTGEDVRDELIALGRDMVSYFGRGCRSVTKLFVPEGYNLTPLLDVISEHYAYLKDHPKYFNNYEYYRSIFLVNKEEHLDTGFLIFKRSDQLGSPLSVVYYEAYNDVETLETKLNNTENDIQCRIGVNGLPFGQAQCPTLLDYPDNVDVAHFISKLA